MIQDTREREYVKKVYVDFNLNTSVFTVQEAKQNLKRKK